ncbi:MAG: tyrosine-type recombinase/integrase [Acidimicrobiia bacterium]
MAKAGYSFHFLSHTRKVIKLAVDEGIQRGVWDGSRHPLVGVTVPRPNSKVEDGRPDLTMVPTESQASEVIVRLATDRPVYGVMAATAAFSGVRFGELLALTVESVDLDRRRLLVAHNCVESDSGRFSFRAPAKRNARSREVVIEPELADVLTIWLSELPPNPPTGAHIDGRQPGRLLFTTDNGNPFRRSAHSKVFRRHTNKISGWPRDATWHYLRHYAATRWIRLGVEVPTVSVMLGHSQVSTTYDWYVNVDEDALDRAALVLSR